MQRCAARTIKVDAHADSVSRLAQTFGALAVPVRLMIIKILLEHGDVCTCEIASALRLKQPTVTHHLKTLEEAGIIYRRPKGKWTYFGLDGDRVSDVMVLAGLIGTHGKQHGDRVAENGRPPAIMEAAGLNDTPKAI